MVIDVRLGAGLVFRRGQRSVSGRGFDVHDPR